MTHEEAAKRYRIVPSSGVWRVQMWCKVFWYTLEEFESVKSAEEYMEFRIENLVSRCNDR